MASWTAPWNICPTDEELEERHRQGRGLTRPELALLLAYGKIALNHALTVADSAADPYLARELERYFPAGTAPTRRRSIKRHRLRSQIITTATTNSIVNRVGPALLMHCMQGSGADAAAVARAYTIARDSAELRSMWAQIEALDGRIPAVHQYDALLEASRYLIHMTLWLVAHRREYGEVGVAVKRLQPPLRELAKATPTALEGLDRERYRSRTQAYASQGFPESLAQALAALEPLRVALDLSELMRSARASARVVTRVHFGLAARLGLDWLHVAIEQLPGADSWQRSAQARLQAAAAAAHQRINTAVLGQLAQPAARAAASEPAMQRWQLLLRDLRALVKPDLAALTVAVEALSALAAGRCQDLAGLL